jgi:hypothetical protein
MTCIFCVISRSVGSYQDRDFSEQLQQLKMRFYQETADEVGVNKEARHQRRHRHRHGKNKTATDSEQQSGVRTKQNLHYLAG